MTYSLDGKFKGRDFLTLYHFTPEEITYFLEVAFQFKEKQKKGEPHRVLEGKTLGMIFQKPSTRTRVSFEVGMYQLGGFPLFLSSQDLQIKRGEPIQDTARVLSRYVDGIMIRTYSQQEVEDLARYADIPVINGLTDMFHPCQVLADLMTIREKKGALAGLKLGYIGDGNNVANSLLIGGAKTGMKVIVASPPGYQPPKQVVDWAREDARKTGGEITITEDPLEAAREADVLYTDVWASMGQEKEAVERKKVFSRYQINEDLLHYARPDAIVLHCLPAHRGEEITEEVMEGPQSAIFDQAENRLHAQKAILALLL
nr:ornithine carbamoyltransferase [Calderihabitans maritimus]